MNQMVKFFMSTTKQISSRTKDAASSILQGESLKKHSVTECGNSCLQRKKNINCYFSTVPITSSPQAHKTVLSSFTIPAHVLFFILLNHSKLQSVRLSVCDQRPFISRGVMYWYFNRSNSSQWKYSETLPTHQNTTLPQT